MGNNIIRDFIGDHFISKKKHAICHIPVIKDTEALKLFTISNAYGKYIYKIFIVAVASQLEQKEFH